MLELMSTTQRHLNDSAVRPSAMPADAHALQRLQHYHRHHELLEAQLEQELEHEASRRWVHTATHLRPLVNLSAPRRTPAAPLGSRPRCRTTRRCTRGGTTGAGATLTALGPAASTSSGCCGRRASSFFACWRGGSSTPPRAGTLMSTTEHPRRRARLRSGPVANGSTPSSRRRIVNVLYSPHRTHATLGAACHAGWKPRLLATQLLRPWSRSSYATSCSGKGGVRAEVSGGQRPRTFVRCAGRVPASESRGSAARAGERA